MLDETYPNSFDWATLPSLELYLIGTTMRRGTRRTAATRASMVVVF